MPKKLTLRERAIFDHVRVNSGVTNQEIAEAIKPKFGELHRNTIGNDLAALVEKGLIRREGAGGLDTRYVEKIPHLGYKSFDVEAYFSKQADERILQFPRFNPDVFELMKDTFTDYELKKVHALNEEYKETIKSYTPTQIKRELERFTIELAWKSSRIEGNTYTLIDTEILLKKNQEAQGHDKMEAIEIYNHKKAIDYILEHREKFQVIDAKKIIELHAILTEGLEVETGIRNGSVGIVGTTYKPLESRLEIDAALSRLVELIDSLSEPIEKAFVAVVMISYLQPFFDGNKRTGRILGNGILLAYGMAPLSYRSVDEASYKKGMILFYEQNSFRYFKELFIDQFKFSINSYFPKPEALPKE